jgi:NAD(P)-dependent dehydrogenase (short-subunit alcohol dehydrogenase family)
LRARPDGGNSTGAMAELQGDRGETTTPLKGRRALVVGGSGGIGAALALELGNKGASLLVHGGSSRERLDKVLGGLEARGVEATGFLMKLEATPESIDGLIAALPSLGIIDILAVAFGPFVRKSLAETEAAEWERVALLDLALPGALASALLPAMAGRGWGRMLFFGGTRTDGIRSYSTNAAYAAAKTGLGVLVKSLAAEGAGSGVGSVLVCPGLVDTEYMGEATREAYREKAPGKRLIRVGEVAKAAVDLIAAEPCLASGSIVSLDGGLSF